MKEEIFDYKKAYKNLYIPKTKPTIIDVESMWFIMVDGVGDPKNNDIFEEAIKLLYGISYAIKMSNKKNKQPNDYFKYVVAPLEGLWWINEGVFSFKERDNWKWTLMIRQPS